MDLYTVEFEDQSAVQLERGDIYKLTEQLPPTVERKLVSFLPGLHRLTPQTVFTLEQKFY